MGIIGWTNDESTVIGSRKSLSVWKLPCWPQMESNATNHWATHDHSPRERKPRAWIAHGWPAFVVFVWKQEPLRAVMHHDMECKWIRCPSAKRSPAQSRHKKPPRMTCSCSVHSFIRMRRSHWVMMYRLKGIASLRSCIWGDRKEFTTDPNKMSQAVICKIFCAQRRDLIAEVAPKPQSVWRPSWAIWRRSEIRCVPTSCQVNENSLRIT